MADAKSFCYMTFIIFNLLIPIVASFKYDIPEDARLNFTELGRKYGQIVEEHDVTTEDGYILKLFNIPGNKSKTVLLVAGIFDTGDTFILRGNTSLSVALARAGYEVWVLTTRGVTYSRRHVTLDPDFDSSFWDFSFHEIGYYDLPATIDYILTKTGADKLSAIGHSLGNTIFYVLGSTKPEYNSKINILIALGPVCYLDNYKWPINGIIEFGKDINKLLLLFDKQEIFDDNSLTTIAMRKLCTKAYIGYDVCANVFFIFAGYDVEEFEAGMYYTVIGHYPKSTSRKTILHLVQVAQRGSFSQFDNGSEGNLERYNTTGPPDYDLSKVTMPVALFVGRNDKLTPLHNVRKLAGVLPNLVEMKVMERKKFNHIDFTWGRHMKVYLFPHVFTLLDKFS